MFLQVEMYQIACTISCHKNIQTISTLESTETEL